MDPVAPRERLPLDGTWSFSTDPGGLGDREGWPARRGFEREVQVPSPWQLYAPELVAYTGHAWYHRAFELPEVESHREAVIRFDAVDYEARVWVDGRLLANHEGGYTPFEAVLPADLEAGTHHLVLAAYDPRDNAEIPHGKQGSWYTRVSGPWQPVTLEVRDRVHVTRVHVTPDLAGGRATVAVTAAGAAGQAVEVTLLGPDGGSVAHAAGTLQAGQARFELSIAAPRPWSPEDPALYTARVQVGRDATDTRFGLRDVSYQGGLIHLNGRPLYIRGALDQAFYPETVYRAPSLEAIEREIGLAKAMGLNLLRKHIKLEDPRYLDACDRLGMLIWEEPACFARYTPQAKARFTSEIEAMVARDYNHPSIIAWSLYNEEWGLEWRLWRDAEKQDHVEALYRHAKALDPTRLICDNSGWAHVLTDLNDCHRYFVAPDSIRECEADLDRYVSTPEVNFVEGKQANAKGVPVLVSEFGAWGLPEPSRIERFYQGRPWWFEAQWAGHVEEFKYPSTAYRAFERYDLASVFGDLDGLGRVCQRRMMTALKPIIELMRARHDLAGYVVTEFTDIEWESNGWLDYFREPKAHFDEFPWFNGETVVMTRLNAHNLRAGDRLQGSVVVSNHAARGFAGTVRWRVEAAAGEFPIEVPPHGNAALPSGAIAWDVPEGPVRAATLVLELWEGDRRIATNQEPLTLHPAAPAPLKLAAPLWLAPGLEHLRFPGATLTPELTPDALAVTATLDARMRAHAASGGRVLYLAEAGDADPDKGDMSFRRLPPGESWDRAASVMYARPELWGALPMGLAAGWECEDLFPRQVLAIANYMHDFGGRGIELTSNQSGLAARHLLAGYFEGWLGKLAATVARVPLGQGAVLLTTWRLVEGHASQPMAAAMLGRLAEVALETGG